MKKLIFGAGIALGTIFWAGPAAAWLELKGDHFIIYYEQEASFARKVLHQSERYYKNIADELGYPRYSNFWQWENRAKIYIYATEADYQKFTGEAEWSNGVAVYSKKEIHTYVSSEGFLDGILPHEITHLIFRDFVGFGANAPVWIDEGVAQWEEPAKRAIAKKIARWLIQTDRDLALQDLTNADPRKMEDPDKVKYFYMQSVSLVDYLVRAYGVRAFTDFCRSLRDGNSFEECLRTSFKVENQWELQEKWRKEVMGDPEPEETEIYVRN